MALRSKFFTLFTLVFAVTAFSVFTSAQETTPAPKEGDKKVEKPERRGFGRHGGFGRMGGKFGGRMGRMGGMHGGMGMRGGPMGRMGGLLGITLTDAQKEQIKAIHEANKPTEENKALFDQIRETRKAGGTITEEQKAQMKSLREAQKAKMEGVHAQILAILTPEQKAQLEAKKAEMQQRMEERRLRMQERRLNRQPGDAKKPEAKKPEVKPTDNN
ncbi:MAG: Spy/CpxP family protein refolding chaperone [Pyrinomonadaceae bacterium]|nr:Spy/CpxP family protein refolding chaperone [Pyrinomonadaceae bacterium]